MTDLDTPSAKSPLARWITRLAGGICPSLAAAAALTGFQIPAHAADAPRVRALLKAARTVVRAHVSDLTEYDNGRLVVASLRVDESLTGTAQAGSTLQVIEMRDLPTRPLFVAKGDLIAFLVPTASNTYLAKHLPKGDYMSPVKTKPGTLIARSADDAAHLARLVQRVAGGPARDSDRDQRATASRQLGFDLLSASHPFLVEDGLITVAAIENLSESLSESEQQVIDTALQRTDLPTRLRILLIQTVADRGLKQMIPALRAIEAPELADASWDALSRLGAPPSSADTSEKLASREPAVRIAAIQQLLRQEKSAAVPRALQLARTDPDTKVRVAAIEAMGASGAPEAVPALEQVYTDPSWDTRQAVGRALTRVGGRTAAESFERLAFTGPQDGQRYATVLLLVTVQRDDPLVQRLIETHPNPEIRELAEHGLEVHEH